MSNKKLCIFTILLAIAVGQEKECDKITKEALKEMNDANEKCVPMYGIEDFVCKIYNQELIDDGLHRAQLLCLYMNLGIIDNQGNPVLEEIRRMCELEKIPEEDIQFMLENCTEKKQTFVETAWVMNLCPLEGDNGKIRW